VSLQVDIDFAGFRCEEKIIAYFKEKREEDAGSEDSERY
jgi:hypothetical protein